MSSLKTSQKTKTSLKQKLFSTKEFNFTNKFLWKLPGIGNRYKPNISVFNPDKVPIRNKFKKVFSYSLAKQTEVKNKEKDSLVLEKPHLVVTGTPKACEKQYFRKTYFIKLSVPRQTLTKLRKSSLYEEYNLNGWAEEETTNFNE
jgi:hypothetical protein